MIEISGLTKRYGSHTVLDNIDFTVEPGSIAAAATVPAGRARDVPGQCCLRTLGLLTSAG